MVFIRLGIHQDPCYTVEKPQQEALYARAYHFQRAAARPDAVHADPEADRVAVYPDAGVAAHFRVL